MTLPAPVLWKTDHGLLIVCAFYLSFLLVKLFIEISTLSIFLHTSYVSTLKESTVLFTNMIRNAHGMKTLPYWDDFSSWILHMYHVRKYQALLFAVWMNYAWQNHRSDHTNMWNKDKCTLKYLLAKPKAATFCPVSHWLNMLFCVWRLLLRKLVMAYKAL